MGAVRQGFLCAVCAVFLILLLFPSLAKAQTLPIEFYCDPYTETYLEGGYYNSTSGVCTYISTSFSFGNRVGEVYRGTVGSSTILSGHFLGIQPNIVQVGQQIIDPVQEEDFFTIIRMLTPTPGESQQFRDYFTQGIGEPPHQDWGILRWKWGEPPGCTENCFSNVLFLPGLQASRLYNAGGTEIWVPSIGEDLTQLLLNNDGTSAASVHTDDIVDRTYGAVVYESFIENMNSVVSDGTINEWKPFPYDWRLDINDVVHQPVATTNGPVSLLEEVERLASTSKSGKVIIIAHSNGGLIGKLLISALADVGKEDLIDKFIMVAVPQLGTPKAIATMLHGEGMPFNWFPFIATAQETRAIGENMPSGYTLLPSVEYFNRVLDPVVEFVSSQIMQPYIDTFGFAVANKTELEDFLLGTDGRSKPGLDDLFTPNVLNQLLLNHAQQTQQELDIWQAPETIEAIQIAGWGLPTIRGIQYLERDVTGGFCGPSCTILDHEPLLTIDGDQTVVTPSAAAMSNVATYYFNLGQFNREQGSDKKHFNILETPQLHDFIESLINNDVAAVPYITKIKPDDSSTGETFRIKIHSPVALNIYDAQGRHTGISTSTLLVEEQIPNSYYFEMGEGKYVGADIISTTTAFLLGNDLGIFTLEVEQLTGELVVASATFTEIPVTENSVASLAINESSSPDLVIDIDGDGATDASISSGEGISPQELIGILEGLVRYLDLPEKQEKKFLKRLKKLKQVLEREYKKDFLKKQKIDKAFDQLQGFIERLKNKNLLTEEETGDLSAILNQIKDEMIE